MLHGSGSLLQYGEEVDQQMLAITAGVGLKQTPPRANPKSTGLLTPPKPTPHLPCPRPRGRHHTSFSSRAIPTFESIFISVTLQIYPQHPRTPSYPTAESHLQLHRPSPSFRLVALYSRLYRHGQTLPCPPY